MPPRTQPSESKQGLVISLVFFVLLSIILGVTTYFGYSEQQKYIDQAKEATTKADSQTKSRNEEKVLNVVYRTAMGITVKDDAQDLLAAKGKPDYEAAVKSLKGIKWDPKTEDKPAQSYADLVEANAKEINNLGIKLAESGTTVKSTQADLEQEKRDHQKDKADLQQALVKAQNDLKKVVDTHSEAFEEQLKRMQQRADKEIKLTKDSKEAEESHKDEVAKLNKTIKEQKVSLLKLHDEIKATPLLDYEEAKGKVVRIERSGSFAYVNLGSADRVKPQLTFSIFGAGTYKADRDPKGSIEVVSVLEAHLSMARITNVRDGNRDPILTGDLLYNPAWSPTLKQHVAIAGFVDLAGEGSQDSITDSIRNLKDFITNLEKQNIVVDSYVNIKDASILGEMTLKTNYLVLGDQGEFGSGTSPLDTGNATNTRKNDVNKKRSEMQEEAARKGIAVVPVRRFAALIGYRIPASARDEYSGSSSYVPSEELKGPGKDSDKDEGAKPPEKKAKPAKGKPAKDTGEDKDEPAPDK